MFLSMSISPTQQGGAGFAERISVPGFYVKASYSAIRMAEVYKFYFWVRVLNFNPGSSHEDFPDHDSDSDSDTQSEP